MRKSHRLRWSHSKWWLPAVVVVVVLTVWEWQVRSGRLSALFFPAPSVIALALSQLLTSGELAIHVGATLSRMFLGLTLGGVAGLVLGPLMGWSRSLRSIVDPFIAAAHPVPKIALLPVIIIIFGIGESSKVVVVAVGTFFPMLINAMAGVRQISPIQFDVAKNYGASLTKVFTRVVVPGSLPLVLAGTRLALNMALLLTVAVELVAAREGLGAMIWFAWETLRTEQLYAALVVTAVLGTGFNVLLQHLAIHVVPWQAKREI